MSLLALAARAPDDRSASFPSSRFAVRHHSNLSGAFLSTMPLQDARCGAAFPGNACSTVQVSGTNCGGFGAFTSILKYGQYQFPFLCHFWSRKQAGSLFSGMTPKVTGDTMRR